MYQEPGSSRARGVPALFRNRVWSGQRDSVAARTVNRRLRELLESDGPVRDSRFDYLLRTGNWRRHGKNFFPSSAFRNAIPPAPPAPAPPSRGVVQCVERHELLAQKRDKVSVFS